ncbi:adenosylmethionine decarboxylase [Bacillus sp. DTU_2020_1000418_1_SI_GHA_SEK_038]|uniref:adenosylmethionine decarboxylase n=1 Tax=Bacillus sp. DTU_2020_1000418_1_SI_GHA_SEK_038 TaxID=3077585 RepID=UPI0039775E08
MITSEHQTFGRHIILDAWGIEFEKLNNKDFLKYHMEKAGVICGATILSVDGWAFDPFGVTVMVVLAESHLSIHTYPEKGYAAIDGYTCGDKINPDEAIDYLVSVFKPSKIYKKKIIRGSGPFTISYHSEDE